MTMKTYIQPIDFQNIRLRLIEQKDLVTTLSWRNRDDARIWFKTSNQITIEQHQSWFNQYLQKDDDYVFVIEFHEILVGQVSVYNIQFSEGCAEVGRFLVSPLYTGKGYMKQACTALIHLCYKAFKLKYLYLEVLESNERALHLYQKIGFSEESRYAGLIHMGYKIEPRKDTNDQR